MIQFIDLKAQRERLEADILRRIQGVLDHCQFIMGPEVAELEQRLAEYCGADHVITCASGTDALLLVLMAHGVGPGDAVLTTPFTFIATAEVISLLGATPVYVDVDPATYTLDPDALRRTLESFHQDARWKDLTPRGVIPVDLYGLPADYRRLNKIAAEHGLFMLEDGAQSFGGSVDGHMVGDITHAATTSFFPAKPLGCYGDGGAVMTNDGEFADVIRSLRVHGKGSHKYDNMRIGLNARLDTMQAAVLLGKMVVFAEEIELRNRIAARYDALLDGLDGVIRPHVPEGHRSAWAQYTIRLGERDRVQTALKAAGVPSVVYYPTPMHLQTAFADLGYRKGDLPESESAAAEVLSLPMYPYLPESDQEAVVRALRDVL